MNNFLFTSDQMAAMDKRQLVADHPFEPYIQHFGVVLSSSEATSLFSTLLGIVPWTRRSMLLHGREVVMPRDIAWYGATKDQGVYAADARPWPDELQRTKAFVEERTGFIYNGCLCNLYRDGNDSVAWHSDKEAFGGAVASLSLGATRVFRVREKNDHTTTFDFALLSGSLLLMRPGCQERTEHTVPKTRKVHGPRINLFSTSRHRVTRNWTNPHCSDHRCV